MGSIPITRSNEFSAMQITLNGEPFQTTDGSRLFDLIEQLALGDKRFAVEINEEVVVRSEYPERQLCEGDRVEIVQAIGGG